jgi:CheY-like chemotaxis protein
MVVKLMESMGHTCVEADDGDVAVDLIRNKKTFDVILME